MMTEDIIFAITMGSVLLIAGLGLHILLNLCGQVSIIQATYVGLAAFLSSYLSRSSIKAEGVLAGKGMPFPQSLVITSLVTGVLAVFFGLLTTKFRGTKAIGPSIAASALLLYVIKSLGFLVGDKGIATSSRTMSFGKTDFTDLTIFDQSFSRGAGIMILSIVFALIALLYTWNVSRSPLGMFMKVIREQEKIAETYAVSPAKTILSAHFLCGLLAGVSGSIYAHVLNKFEIGSVSPWLGVFGLLATIQIVFLIKLSPSKHLLITSLIVFVSSTACYLFVAVTSDSDLFNANGSRFTPSLIVTLAISALVIACVRYTVWRNKVNDTKSIDV